MGNLEISRRMNIPSFIKDTFLQFLREYYSQDPDFTWCEDETQTGILIHDRKTINLETVANKPQISIIRTPIRFGEVGIDQKKRFWVGPSAGTKYLDMMNGNIVLQCISRVGLEAELIATTTLLAIQTFKNTLYERGVHKIQGLSIGDEQVIDQTSDYEIIMVPVSVPYYISIGWECQPVGPPMENMDMSFFAFTGGPITKRRGPEVNTPGVLFDQETFDENESGYIENRGTKEEQVSEDITENVADENDFFVNQNMQVNGVPKDKKKPIC